MAEFFLEQQVAVSATPPIRMIVHTMNSFTFLDFSINDPNAADILGQSTSFYKRKTKRGAGFFARAPNV